MAANITNQAQLVMLLNEVSNLTKQVSNLQNQLLPSIVPKSENLLSMPRTVPNIQTQYLMPNTVQPQMDINLSYLKHCLANQVTHAIRPNQNINVNRRQVSSAVNWKAVRLLQSKQSKTKQRKNRKIREKERKKQNQIPEEESIRCIWVKGIPEEYQNADKMINVFGMFSNIQKIKFFDKEPDVILIEMHDAKGAEKAAVTMNNQEINGGTLQVSLAESNDVKIESDDNKSRDSTNIKEAWRYRSVKRRYKIRDLYVLRMKDVPSKVVVGNVPKEKLDQLKQYIIESGFTVKSIEGSKVRFGDKPQESKIQLDDKPGAGYTKAVVELANPAEAICAIANLHKTWPNNFGAKDTDKEGRSNGLRFAFSSSETLNSGKE